MRVNSSSAVQHATYDDNDAGEGLSIFFSQNGDSVCRYRFLVKAKTDSGMYDVGEFYSSPPLATPLRPGRLSRCVAMAVCPGAVTWTVEVSAVPDSEGVIAPETADIILASSRCCTSPVGVTRVAERYRYRSHDNTGILSNLVIQPGMRVTGIAVLGASGDGTVVIAGGDIILVPSGISINLEPGANIPPNAAIEFNNVLWTVEFLESA